MKLKAFTFLELLVVIAITGIVVAISYTSYQMIIAQHSIYKNSNDMSFELELLETTLNKDIQQAHQVESTTQELMLTYFDGSFIAYNFNSNFILRQHTNRVDTFFIASSSLITETIVNKDLVYYVMVEIPVKTDNVFKIGIQKQYGAVSMIEQ